MQLNRTNSETKPAVPAFLFDEMSRKFQDGIIEVSTSGSRKFVYVMLNDLALLSSFDDLRTYMLGRKFSYEPPPFFTPTPYMARPIGAHITLVTPEEAAQDPSLIYKFSAFRGKKVEFACVKTEKIVPEGWGIMKKIIVCVVESAAFNELRQINGLPRNIKGRSFSFTLAVKKKQTGPTYGMASFMSRPSHFRQPSPPSSPESTPPSSRESTPLRRWEPTPPRSGIASFMSRPSHFNFSPSSSEESTPASSRESTPLRRWEPTPPPVVNKNAARFKALQEKYEGQRLKGILQFNSDFVYLKIEDNLIKRLFNDLKQVKKSTSTVVLPPYFHGAPGAFANPIGAHITVISRQEMSQWNLNTSAISVKLGEEYSFSCRLIQKVIPTHWRVMRKIWIFSVESHQLDLIRSEQFSLHPRINGLHDFHFTFAAKWWDTPKTAIPPAPALAQPQPAIEKQEPIKPKEDKVLKILEKCTSEQAILKQVKALKLGTFTQEQLRIARNLSLNLVVTYMESIGIE